MLLEIFFDSRKTREWWLVSKLLWREYLELRLVDTTVGTHGIITLCVASGGFHLLKQRRARTRGVSSAQSRIGPSTHRARFPVDDGIYNYYSVTNMRRKNFARVGQGGKA